MTVVGFDTATADTAVCATRAGKVVHEELIGLDPDGSPRHSTALLVEIERAVDAAGGWDGVGLIAVGLGPGSFVGIRIGLATARGLAASTGVPVVGVCTLDALARGMVDLAEPELCRLAVLDARRGEAFVSLYTASGERLWEPLVAGPEELAGRVDQLSAMPVAAGSGAVRFRDELASRGVEVPGDDDPVHRVSARHVCALAAAAEPGDNSLEPIYLRQPDAQRWRERDTSTRTD